LYLGAKKIVKSKSKRPNIIKITVRLKKITFITVDLFLKISRQNAKIIAKIIAGLSSRESENIHTSEKRD